MKKALLLVGLLAVLVCLYASGRKEESQSNRSQVPHAVPSPSTRTDADFGKIPLLFIPNKGQLDEQVDYYVQGRDKTIYFTAKGLTFVLSEAGQPEQEETNKKTWFSFQRNAPPAESLKKDLPSGDANRRWAVKLDFVGSNKDVKPITLENSGAVVSYFMGKPEEWKAGLAAASKIIYKDLWPGIDLIYSGTYNRMKYEFVVDPGADPALIRLAYRGAENVAITEEGRLAVITPVGSFEDDIPVAYQDSNGKRVDISMAYKRVEHHTFEGEIGADNGDSPKPTPGMSAEIQDCIFGFEIGDYDRNYPLVLDPAVLVYCGYIGGDGDDQGFGIAIDISGNAYVTGYSSSTEATFPVTVGPDVTLNGGNDVFIAKVNASGTALAYCGFLGGEGGESANAIVVDGSGNAYITGTTSSTESTFPVTIGPDLTHNGSFDAFITKLNASGTAILYCGYVGGLSDEWGYGIAVDGFGNAYVTGSTYSSESTFPVTGGPGLINNGGYDAFVAKVESSGSAFVYCGYIGGSGIYEGGYGIAVDSTGNAYIVGSTDSTESTFPVTTGPDLTHNGGSYDAFVAKVNASGTALNYCGYLGGESGDGGSAIAVDDSGNAYITGGTFSTESTFPIAVGPDLTYNGRSDAFVAKLNSSGTGLIYCGFIGGSEIDSGNGIAVDNSGNAFVTGHTFSTESTFPVIEGPGLVFTGAYEAFVAKVCASGSALAFCGYIGGYAHDFGQGIDLDSSGHAYVVGSTYSSEPYFPVRVGPYLNYSGSSDVFVAKINSGNPTVQIKNPANGSVVSGIVPIQVDAFEQKGILKVEIYIDDVLISADTTYPYGYSWNTSGLVGTHTIKAISYDVLNITALAQITVDVVNELPPIISIHPQSQIIASGQTALLAAEASGTEPIYYQWYRGASGDTSDPIGGATSNIYAALGLTSASSYWVQVSNAYGNATSNTAVITIGLPSELVGTVYDITTKASISGATVALDAYPQVLTDTNGHYEIPDLSPGEYLLTLTKAGYNTFSSTVGISLSSTITRNFSLRQTASGPITIDSLTTKYDGFVYFLEGVGFTVTFTAHVNWGGHIPGKVCFITPKGRYDVTATEDTVSRDFNIADEFGPCTTLKAIAFGSDGAQSEIKKADFTVMNEILPGILFTKMDRGDSFYYRSRWSQFKLIDEALNPNVMPGDIPFFGKRGFNFSTKVPIEIEVEGSGEVDIDIDLPVAPHVDKDLWAEWAKGQMAGVSFTLTPRFNLSGQYSYPECKYNWTRNFGLSGEFRIERSAPAPIVGLPFYIKGTIEMSVDASLGVEDINPSKLVGQFSFEPYVRGSVGAGISKFLAVEGWAGGGAEFVFRYPQLPHLHEARVYINLGWSTYLFGIEREKELKNWDWDLNFGTDQAPELSQAESAKPKPISRDYLNSVHPGIFLSPGLAKSVATTLDNSRPKISSAALQESVFPYSDPCLSYDGGLLGLTWLQDDPLRLAINRTSAMSSIYEGTAWSTPVTIGDDGTADFHPQHLMFDGGNAIAAWEDEKIVHAETATLEDIIANLEISASAYDPISGTWQPFQRLTDNNYLDGSPLISGPTASDLILTWISNEANDLMGSPSAPNKLWYSLYNGTTWSTPQQAAEIPLGLVKFNLIYNGTTAHIVMSLDMDGDSVTVADNELYRLDYTGGAWGTLTRFTEDNLPDVNPKLTFDPTGRTVLVWMRGNELSCSVDFAAPTVIYTDEFSTNLADFKLAASSGGRIALIWSKPAEYNSDLNVIFYDPAYQTWGAAPHQITFDPDVERNLAVTFYGANKLVAAYDRTPVETTTLTRKTANGKMVTLDIPQLGITDFYILEYTMGRDLALSPMSLRAYPMNPEPGAGATLVVTVINSGDETAVSAPVAFYLGDPANGGTLIGEELIEGNLNPGAHTDISFLWEVPETTAPLTIYAVIDPASAFDTAFRTDNTLSLEIVKPDLTMNGVRWDWLGADKVAVTARVVNAGVIPSAATTVKFRRDSASGTLLSDIVLPSLAKGESRDVSYEWDVTGLGLTEYLVHVSLDEENVVAEFDEANNTKLTTVTPTVLLDAILVMSPNGGETWTARTVQPIQWASSGIVGDVMIEYSIDGGATYLPIVASTPNDGSYEWTVENVSSATCLVRISETDGFPTDTSDGVFMIVGIPEIAVTSPNGGERWTVGSTHEVTWTAAALSGTVTVDLYKGGVKIRTLGTPDAADGSLSWTIDLDETPGADFRILVWQDSVSDDSDADFAVVRTVRVDFNRDGQEDLLWRYYGEGGYNRAWFLGNTEATGLPQPTSDPRMDLNRRDRDLREKMIKRGLSDPQGMGLSSGRPAIVPDIRALMGGRTVPMTVDDPRKAGRGVAATSRSGLMDPRQAGTLVPSRSAPAALASSVPSIIGGADVMAVGDLTWQIVGTGDFDNDTHVDILWRNNVSGMNVVWFMNGTGWVSSAELLPVGDLTWQIVGTGVFNNDTHVDILWRNSSDGSNVVWYMDGTTWIGSTVLLGVSDQTWQIVGTGDFNKDGNIDLLWRYEGAGGYNVVWYLNNATWIGSAELIPVGDTAWQIMGTGDYDNDGNIDILWRYNGVGGYNVIWYMNGVTWSSSAELIPVPDLSWRIVSR